jgi:hypothetical protein
LVTSLTPWGHARRRRGGRPLNVPLVAAPSSQLAVAIAFLREVLGRGPRPVTEVLTLARQRGISRATLWRAKRALWVQSEKIGMKAGWAWAIREGWPLWGRDDHVRGR